MLKASPRFTKVLFRLIFAGYPLDLEEFRKLADEYLVDYRGSHAPGGYFGQ